MGQHQAQAGLGRGGGWEEEGARGGGLCYLLLRAAQTSDYSPETALSRCPGPHLTLFVTGPMPH